MAKRRAPDEPVWPPHLAEYHPDRWDSEYEWRMARIKVARVLGFKVLPEIQALTAIKENDE